ncbi:MAG: putative zinc-binding metallopeptidase, partial [Salinisphaera sp.]|nr:putative zinc-binding metallopeptidase [Salinisphaera sp.]
LWPDTSPMQTGSFSETVKRVWIPMSTGLNQINRSMGKDDLYPFVLSPPVLDKLQFVADLVPHVHAAMQRRRR